VRSACARIRPLLPAVTAGLALVLGGCASTSAEPEANKFYADHHQAATVAAAAVNSMKAALASLPAHPTLEQRQALQVAAVRAKRRMTAPSEWAGPERGEEEDLQQAETEVSEGAQDVLKAIRSLRSYARTGDSADLQSYTSQFRTAGEKWNEGVIQLWHLAGKHGPPTI
jgi:uncharacterized protein with von Willebrand factor type A (vWA) domain